MNRTMGHDVIPGEKHFRWQGGEVTRMEGFTDAIFAFAVTLLVVSLEVPKTYSELMTAMKGFAAFAICFALLAQVWVYQYLFSRRYGLHTSYTMFLNFALVFVVLFYVYPLKFIFSLIIGQMFNASYVTRGGEEIIQASQVPALMVIYSLGFSAVFLVFALEYFYAYRKREALNLNEYEILRTRHALWDHVFMAVLGVTVAALARLLPVRMAGSSGFLYFLIGVYHTITGTIFGNQQRSALERLQAKDDHVTNV